MTSDHEIRPLIEDCWQQLFKLHRTLAELKRANAKAWESLEDARKLAISADASDFVKIDPNVWRERAEEVRVLADVTHNPKTKNALLEIAKSYEDLASREISSEDTAG